MRPKLMSTLAVAVLALAACGDDSTDESVETDAGTTEAEENGAAVQTVTSDLGEILADTDGFTLYGFTDDTDGVPTCYDDCAEAWPPLTVDGAELPGGLDPEVFSVVERDDGTSQIVAGDWPLYLYAGDSAAGDTNGHGIQDIWFAVAPDGELIDTGDGNNSDDSGGY